MIEITYNWPDKDNKNEKLEVGRSFGHIAYRVKNIYQICEKLMKEGVPINRPQEMDIWLLLNHQIISLLNYFKLENH